jgi:hypothetical protein
LNAKLWSAAASTPLSSFEIGEALECGGFDAAFPALDLESSALGEPELPPSSFHCAKFTMQSWESGVEAAALQSFAVQKSSMTFMLSILKLYIVLTIAGVAVCSNQAAEHQRYWLATATKTCLTGF